VNATGPGTIVLDPAQGPYPYGSTVQLAAIPNADYDFAQWGNAASGTANPLSFVVTTPNPYICAQFVPVGNRQVTLSASASGEGSVLVSPAQASYAPWTPVTLTATPAPGWRFMRWQGDAAGNANPLNLTLDRSRAVTAYFAQVPVITAQPQGGTHLVGETVTLAVTAEGTDPLSYQWTFNGTNLPGATASSLVLGNIQLTNSGLYGVVVANLAGYTVSDPAALVVQAPAGITAQP
jgi:hypothetical protein